MEQGQNSSGAKRTKEVQLDLRTSANGQKGRTLVGRLEIDKILNKGRPVMYEAPEKTRSDCRTFIRTGVLVNIRNRWWLVFGFLVLKETQSGQAVRFKRLQDYCYDCGGIGHAARQCKYQHETNEDEAEDVKCGNGLGTTQVKTMEDTLVVHDQTWDEAMLQPEKPFPTAGKEPSRRTIDGPALHGKIANYGEKSAPHSLSHEDPCNDHLTFNANNPMHVPSGSRITANHGEKSGFHSVSGEDPSNGHLTYIRLFRHLSSKISPQITPILYRVDSPVAESEAQTAIIPFSDVSPITAVTVGLNRINLKRCFEVHEVANVEDPNPAKKRLIFQEVESVNPHEGRTQLAIDVHNHVTFRNLKKALRGKKTKRKAKIVDNNPNGHPQYTHMLEDALGQSLSLDTHNISPNHSHMLSLDAIPTADGCHQATIGSP
ncbi:hypothetical protein K1719_013688 [Acacia pycnantha]|nr:hypothetical protein K1719_013688 [Acacia pycnantha]